MNGHSDVSEQSHATSRAVMETLMSIFRKAKALERGLPPEDRLVKSIEEAVNGLLVNEPTTPSFRKLLSAWMTFSKSWKFPIPS